MSLQVVERRVRLCEAVLVFDCGLETGERGGGCILYLLRLVSLDILRRRYTYIVWRFERVNLMFSGR